MPSVPVCPEPQIPLNLDVTRISRETVAAVPQKYFGPGLADMSGVGPKKLGFCPETDCYYSSKGAAQYAGDFQITGSRRLPDGTGAGRIQQTSGTSGDAAASRGKGLQNHIEHVF